MLPKSAHPGALAALKEIYNAEDIDNTQLAIKVFEIDYGAKYPKAVAKIVDHADVLLEFYRYPAEHCLAFGRSVFCRYCAWVYRGVGAGRKDRERPVHGQPCSGHTPGA